jgi:hypothetical protein
MSEQSDTPRHDEWETYCDECYYHLWRVRRKNERKFDDGFHVQNGEGARQLVELLNKQDSELTAARQEIKDLHKAYGFELRDPNGTIWECAAKIAAELTAARAEIEEYAEDKSRLATMAMEFRYQRDRLVEEIIGWRNKWECAVDMAARAEVNRDRLAVALQLFLNRVQYTSAFMDGKLRGGTFDYRSSGFDDEVTQAYEALQSLTTNAEVRHGAKDADPN